MNLGFSGEMLFLAFLALILLGPRQLPGILKNVGRIVGEIKRASGDFQGKLNREIENLELEQPVKAISSVADRVRAVSVAGTPGKAMLALVDPEKSRQSAPVSLMNNVNRIREILAKNEQRNTASESEERPEQSANVETPSAGSPDPKHVA